MKKCIPLILFSLLTLTVRADDQTRRIQAALSEAGFYFGTADGKMGEETRAALRRFQIRNGLDVSGEPSAETLAALKIEKSSESSAASADEEQVAASASTPEPPPVENRTESPEPIETPSEPVVTGRSPVRDFYQDTDLADGSTGDQSQELLDAQYQLVKLGYYRSAPDGLPGPETETALLRFQHANHLRLTGRLDADTREALVNAPPSVESKAFRSSKNRPPGVVLRGLWVH